MGINGIGESFNGPETPRFTAGLKQETRREADYLASELVKVTG